MNSAVKAAAERLREASNHAIYPFLTVDNADLITVLDAILAAFDAEEAAGKCRCSADGYKRMPCPRFTPPAYASVFECANCEACQPCHARPAR